MLTERARKDPGKPVGFWKFLILTSIVFTVIRSMLTGKPPATGGVLPFAFLAYFGYRIARLQPWWPFGEDFMENLRKQAEEARRQGAGQTAGGGHLPPPNSSSNPQAGQSLGRVATVRRRVEVESNPLANRRPIREVDVTNRRLPEMDNESVRWDSNESARRTGQSAFGTGAQVSSVSLRSKREREKTVRSKTTNRSKRR